MRIGLFSLKDGVGCTSMSIHVANFLAGNENNKVAIRELKKDGKYKTVKADFAEDGTFTINDVHFYPYDMRDKVNEPVIVDDIGKIGILHKFDADYNKLYLCTDGSDDDLQFFLDYNTENHITPDVLLFGGSKECIHKWQEIGLKVVLIGKAREKRIPQNFAMVLSTFLRISGIVPPVYHADSVYSPIIFGNEIIDDTENEVESTIETPKEPKPFSVKSFVKVPEPTDVYKGVKEKDDGKGIIYTEDPLKTSIKETSKKNNANENNLEECNDDEEMSETFEERSNEEDTPKEIKTQSNVEYEETEKMSKNHVSKDESKKKPIKNDGVVKKDESAGTPFSKKTSSKNKPEPVRNDIEYEEDENDEKKSRFSSINIKIPQIKNPFHKKTQEVSDENDETEFFTSMLGEEPMQGDDFSFDVEMPLKDVNSYALFINKHFTCFGLKQNVHGKHHYDNTDKSLYNLTKMCPEVLQFLTEDLLSGEYTLSRFTAEEIHAMRVYFDFMCTLFTREIGKTVTLREYVEFKQYYNRLCETKLMLDAEENERRRIIHDIYLRYSAYAELYNIDICDENLLINRKIDPFIADLKAILNNHICDDDVKEIIKGLIDETIYTITPKEPINKGHGVAVIPASIAEDDIDDDEDDVQKVPDDPISKVSVLPYKLRVICLDENSKVDDNATYGLMNIERAVYIYMQKQAFIKQLILLDEEENETLLFSSKNGGIIVPAKGDFSDDILEIRSVIEQLMSEF